MARSAGPASGSTTGAAGEARAGGQSHSNCMCTLPWCQSLFRGRLVKGPAGPGLGSVGIATIPDEHKGDLALWLRRELCPNWTSEQIAACVEGRAGAYRFRRIGRWHFEPAMLKQGRGGMVLDWEGG